VCLRKNCKNPDLKGPLGLLLGCFRQQRIRVLLNYYLLWLKEAARECHAHWLTAQLLKRLFTDFKHQLSPIVALLHKQHMRCLSFQTSIQLLRTTYPDVWWG